MRGGTGMTELERKVLSCADEHREELFALLLKLLGFDSQNFVDHGNERPCAEYIEGLYREAGLETERYAPDSVPGIREHPGYLPGRGTDESRPNVSGVLRGTGEGRVTLAAHIDTMPVGDPAKWTVNPFGERKGERIYGLGACDNKFGIANSFFALETLRACGVKLKKDVVLTSYVDEEYGGGNGSLAACLKYPSEVFVNTDGGNFEIWNAALGGGGMGITVETNFITDTVTPVLDALYLIRKELEPFAKRRREELHKNPLYTGSDMERSAFRITEFGVGSKGTNLDSGRLLCSIYTDKPRETIIKELAEVVERVTPYLEANHLRTGGFVHTTRYFDYAETEDEGGAMAAMHRAAEEVRGEPVKVCGSCLTDLSIYLPYGAKTSFNFGIIRDFALYGGAHQPDEFVECKDLLDHAKALLLFLMRYCGIAE